MDTTINKTIRRWSKSQMLTCIILASLASCASIEHVLINFLTPYQDHWCYVEEVSHCSQDVQKSLIVPGSRALDGYEYCSMKNVNYSDYSSCKQHERNDSIDSSTKCPFGYVFNKTLFQQTVTSKFSLVCENAWILDIMSPIYACGLIVGSFISGIFADKKGRKICLMLSVCLHVLSGIISSFASNVWAFAFGRFLMSVSLRGIGLSALTLLIEIFPSAKIQMASWIFLNFYNFGPYVLVLLAYYVRDYQWLQFSMSIPYGLTLFCWWIIPESPTWLLSKGKFKEAIKQLKSMSKLDEVNHEIENMIRHETFLDKNTGSKKMTFVSMIKHRKLLYYLYVLTISTMAATGTHIGISFNIGLLYGDIYSNIAISTSLDFFAVLFVGFFIQNIKRKLFNIIIFTLLTCVHMLTICFIVFGVNQMIVTIATLVIRMLCQAISPIGMTYQSELFPTSIRQQSYGITFGISGLFAIAVPLIAGKLRLIWLPAPYVIFSIISAIAAISHIPLPETRGQRLPENADDVLRKENETADSVAL